MYLFRRTAARAIASPSTAVFVKPRSITTITPAAFQQRKQWVTPYFQRRFASDEAAVANKADQTATTENFAQTAAEAPVDENLSPAQEAVHAAPASSTNALGAGGAQRWDALSPGSRRGRDRIHSTPPAPNDTVYVGNLYYEVTGEQLERVFSRFGKVKAATVIYDNRGLSRGFGYVEFNNADEAQASIENLDMQPFEGRNLVVQFHRPKPNSKTIQPNGTPQPNPPSKTLFIGNMSFEMSDKDLNDLFRDVRNVVDVRVAIDRRTGQPRGFAHADFIDVASATRAKDVLKEKNVYGRQLRVDFSKSGTRQQREAQGPKSDES